MESKTERNRSNECRRDREKAGAKYASCEEEIVNIQKEKHS